MQLFVDYLKGSWRLSSPFFLLDLVTIGVVLLYLPRTRAWGRRWLTAAVAGFWFVATPLGSSLLSAPLTRNTPRIESVDQAGGADVIVVLGGGTDVYQADGMGLDDLEESALSVIEGARLYQLLGDPMVIVSGGNTDRLEQARSEAEAFERAIVELGVPPERVTVEDRSMTTRDQALILKTMLAAWNVERFILVTSPTHMSRSLATFRAAGLSPVPSAARLRTDRPAPWWTVVPDRESMQLSDSAAYEYAAWIYYRLRRWV